MACDDLLQACADHPQKILQHPLLQRLRQGQRHFIGRYGKRAGQQHADVNGLAVTAGCQLQQVGVEAIGIDDPALDAEVIAIADHVVDISSKVSYLSTGEWSDADLED